MSDRLDNTLTIPPTLKLEIQALASREHLAASDVLADIIALGLEEHRWRRTLAYGAGQAKALGATEADVPRLIAEARNARR